MTFNRATYALGKFLIVASRAINVIIWVLLFVVVFGAGALSGVLAVAFRSIGFIAKLMAEEIEEIEYKQVEAVTATGASGVQVLLYSIVPQIKPAFVGSRPTAGTSTSARRRLSGSSGPAGSGSNSLPGSTSSTGAAC